MRASVELWRTERRDLKAEEKNFAYHNAGSWTMRGSQFGPKDLDVSESADVVDDSAGDAVIWYHRNAHSVVPFTLKHQGLESAASLAGDPLAGRTMGGRLSAAGFVKDGATLMRSAGEVNDFEIKIAAHTAQTESVDAWRRQTEALLRQVSVGPGMPPARTADWWRGFWDRSWIVVQGDPAASQITQSYALQRWVNACGGRGKLSDQVQRVDLHGRSKVYGQAG